MNSQIESARKTLEEFAQRKKQGESPMVDRKEVVAHATLSALAHHWPSQAPPDDIELLLFTEEIRQIERSRWMTQRRIAIAKLSREIL